MFEGYYVVYDDDLWLYATDSEDDEGYPVRSFCDAAVSVSEVVEAIWEHKEEIRKCTPST